MAEKKLQMIIRDSGVASRRAAEELINTGHVTVNGKIAEDPAIFVDPERDHIKVDGKLLHFKDEPKYYYLFNKPRHMVSTMSDPEGRSCIGDIVKPLKKGIFPVGRLDFDAEGLMILTNDGTLAQKLSHPSYKIRRTYMVKVKGRPDERTLSTIRKGMSIGDGERLGDIQVNFVKFKETTTWVRVTLSEGKKNEIKRIFFRINHPVRKIRRIMFGPFSLGDLPTGQARLLNKTESVWLQELLAAEPEPRPKADRPRKRSPRESGRRQDEPGKPVHRPKNKV